MIFLSNRSIKEMGYSSTTDFIQVKMNQIGTDSYSIRIEQDGIYFDFDINGSINKRE